MSRNKSKLPFKKWTAWNNIPDKPKDADCISKEGDLVAKIGQIWCLCQRENDYNNIVIFKQPGKYVSKMDVYRCVFAFAYRLKLYAGIEYITVQGREGRYDFLEKLFPPPLVLPYEKEDGWQIWVVRINDETMKRLKVYKKGF